MIDERNAEKLAKVASRLGSDHPGEAANVAARATRMLRAAGWSWSDLIADAVRGAMAREAEVAVPRPEPGAVPDDVRLRAAWLMANLHDVNATEWEFLATMRSSRGEAAEKQAAWMDRLHTRAVSLRRQRRAA